MKSNKRESLPRKLTVVPENSNILVVLPFQHQSLEFRGLMDIVGEFKGIVGVKR